MRNIQAPFPLVPPTTTLFASPPVATGFQGCSEQCDCSHTAGDAANCETKNNLSTAGEQGGRKPLVVKADDVRHIIHEDVALTNTTTAEDPLRRMVTSSAEWVRDGFHILQTPHETNERPHNGALGPLVSTDQDRPPYGYNSGCRVSGPVERAGFGI